MAIARSNSPSLESAPASPFWTSGSFGASAARASYSRRDWAMDWLAGCRWPRSAKIIPTLKYTAASSFRRAGSAPRSWRNC